MDPVTRKLSKTVASADAGGDAAIDTDVLIVGAGPAGCCVAMNLAPFCRVLLIDRDNEPQPRAGESLPPAANKLLADMGLLDEFKQQGHLPCFGNQSRWGSDQLIETDFLRDPQGHGWHLDRPVFERWLRSKAQQRGATLWAPCRLKGVQDRGDKGVWPDTYRWEVTVDAATDPEGLGPDAVRTVRAQVLIDAGGRTPGLAKRLGAQRLASDKLCCAWSIGTPAAHGKANLDSQRAAPTGLSYIESTPQGWWYTAPVPKGRRIVAFHADADSDAVPWMRSEQALLAQAATRPALAQHFSDGAWAGQATATNPPIQLPSVMPTASEFGFTAAHSATTQPCAGAGWLCVGDAALSFDPLSAQGIFNALYTGLAAAEAVHRHLSLGADLTDYAAQISGVETAYRARLAQSYGAEQRFVSEKFWNQRGAPDLRRQRN
jgi:flavin-dependent dehydrogenase